MLEGVGKFNQAASVAYKLLDEESKERLARASKCTEKTKPMTSGEVKKAGAKAFKKIQQQVG